MASVYMVLTPEKLLYVNVACSSSWGEASLTLGRVFVLYLFMYSLKIIPTQYILN